MKDVYSSVLELFLSNDVLYYVILYYVSCFVWTPGRVAAAFATANGDPNKTSNTKEKQSTSAQHMWELLQDCWKKHSR